MSSDDRRGILGIYEKINIFYNKKTGGFYINDRHKKFTNLKDNCQRLNLEVIERLKVMFLQGILIKKNDVTSERHLIIIIYYYKKTSFSEFLIF